MRSLCPLIAALMMSGCVGVTPPSKPITYPELDQYLARDCDQIQPSTQKNYDVWQNEDEIILAALSDCAIRHRKLVQAWPRSK